MTNEEIAGALVEGFTRYVDAPKIPTQSEIITSWRSNSIPYTHSLLALSVFLRHRSGLPISNEALPSCVIAAVTAFTGSKKVPGFDEALKQWIISEICTRPTLVASTLKDLWLAGVEHKRNSLPGFYDLNQNPNVKSFLVELSTDVLRSGIKDDYETVGQLTSVLMQHSQQVAFQLGEIELSKTGLSEEVSAIWRTALFAIDPNRHLKQWKSLQLASDGAVWEAIELISGKQHIGRAALNLASNFRFEIINLLGQRFPNVEHPSGGWSGGRNPWDAAQFIARQIGLLAADNSSDADYQLEKLEKDLALISYRDVIRHQRAQRERRQREVGFSFASPEQVAASISNEAPATPNDLLAFVTDHLLTINRELSRTQNEGYRAYWNESGRKLAEPKREEVCSGLLAKELQTYITAQNLVATVEYHMVADKECDIVVFQGIERILPIEVKHHYHNELWTAWRTQLDRLYTRDAKAGGLGIYLIFWSGELGKRKLPKLPSGIVRPTNSIELSAALVSLIPEQDRQRLRVVVIDIAGP